jgi:hypothetical protein
MRKRDPRVCMSGRARNPRSSTRKTGRRPGQTSAAIRRAARINGRARKRDKLPADVLERLGPPPPPKETDALRLWNARMLAEVQWLVATGKITTQLAESLRAGAGAIGKSVGQRGDGDDEYLDDLEDDHGGAELEDDDDPSAGLVVE